jgi:hypothetical protein
MFSSNWKENAFEAVFEGPPKRKLYVWQEPRPDDPASVVGGWGFSVSYFNDAGEEQPLWDSWEEDFERILLYPPEYASQDIVWRRSDTGEVVDLYSLRK